MFACPLSFTTVDFDTNNRPVSPNSWIDRPLSHDPSSEESFTLDVILFLVDTLLKENGNRKIAGQIQRITCFPFVKSISECALSIKSDKNVWLDPLVIECLQPIMLEEIKSSSSIQLSSLSRRLHTRRPP